MRRVEQIMGMPISIDIPNCQAGQVFDKVFARLRGIDARFSPYKQHSEVSKFGRAELKEEQLSPELKKIIKACREAYAQTEGYFSGWAGGAFDPSGYVKGWAIAEAAKQIKEQGYGTYCISAGGDILAASDSEKTWNIAIQDPTGKHKILSKLSIKNSAVATSGSYERGGHIINPKTGRPATELLSVTVTGPDIIQADIFATASFAMGEKAAAFMSRQTAYEAVIIPSRRSQENSR